MSGFITWATAVGVGYMGRGIAQSLAWAGLTAPIVHIDPDHHPMWMRQATGRRSGLRTSGVPRPRCAPHSRIHSLQREVSNATSVSAMVTKACPETLSLVMMSPSSPLSPESRAQ